MVISEVAMEIGCAEAEINRCLDEGSHALLNVVRRKTKWRRCSEVDIDEASDRSGS